MSADRPGAPSPARSVENLQAENERLARLADIALDLVERACREGEPQATVMKVQLRLRLGFGAALAALRELDRRGRLQGLAKSPHLQGDGPADGDAGASDVQTHDTRCPS